AAPPSVESVEESVEPVAAEETVGSPVRSLVVGRLEALQVEPGHRVRPGQVLGTIEVVGLKHEVRSDAEGEVVEILAQEQEPVEYGQVLLVIRPEAK
ncbi:MAG: biotin/lipoyl-binding protein, partial [Candidatus Eremiobacterota bacterium]